MRLGNASRAAGLSLLMAVSATCLSCASNDLRDASYSSTRGAVAGAADELAQLDKDGALPKVDLAAMNVAVHDLTESAVVGAADGVAKLEPKLEEVVRDFCTAMIQTAQANVKALVQSMIEEQGPRLHALIRGLFVAMLSDLRAELETIAQTDLPQATRLIVSEAVDSFATALGSENLVNLREDLVETTSAVSHSASVGAMRGLREELQNPETIDAFGALAKRVVEEVSIGAKDSIDRGVLWATGLVFGTLFVISVAALFFYFRKSVSTGRALAVVAQQINSGDHTELKRRIQSKAKEKRIESFLSDFLLDHGL